MDLKTLAHDKRLPWVAGGVGALIGLGVLWQRRKSAGGGGSQAGSSSGGIANPAYANTTGTDVANWVGGTLGQYSSQLAAYQQTLLSELQQLQQLGGQQTAAPVPLWTAPARLNQPPPANAAWWTGPRQPGRVYVNSQQPR